MSFTSLYLIRYLNFDYGFISTTTVLSYVAMILSTKIWDKFQNKHGNIFRNEIFCFFVIADFLIYFFLTENLFHFIFILPCWRYREWGFIIAIMAYRFEIMPERAKTIYEGWFKAIYGLSVLIAPAIGELLINIMPDFSTGVFSASKFQLLYLISFITGGIVVFVTFIKPGFIKHKTSDQSCTENHNENLAV